MIDIEKHSIWKTRDGSVAWVNNVRVDSKTHPVSVIVCDDDGDFIAEFYATLNGEYIASGKPHGWDLVDRIDGSGEKT